MKGRKWLNEELNWKCFSLGKNFAQLYLFFLKVQIWEEKGDRVQGNNRKNSSLWVSSEFSERLNWTQTHSHRLGWLLASLQLMYISYFFCLGPISTNSPVVKPYLYSLWVKLARLTQGENSILFTILILNMQKSYISTTACFPFTGHLYIESQECKLVERSRPKHHLDDLDF